MIHDIDLAIEKKDGEEAATSAYKETLQFARELKQKHPDTCETYAAYHALIRSTPNYEPMFGRAAVTNGDFPGDDSVLKFLTNLRRRHNV